MAIHRIKSNKDIDPVFGSSTLAHTAAIKQFPEAEQSPQDVFQLVHDELYLDGNSRQNLATFCQTWEEDEVHKLMDLSIDKNMIDKDEYPQAAEIEGALCADARRSLERPAAREPDRHLHHRLKRGLHARGHGGPPSLARPPQSGAQAHRSTQPGQRTGAGLLAQVLPLLGRGTA